MPNEPHAPLDDPDYEPKYRPINGRPPVIVEKWGPRSQVRWFARFTGGIAPMQPTEWGRFYCSSVEHKGLCCQSCLDDEWDQGYPNYDDHCCCEGYRAARQGQEGTVSDSAD